MAKSTSAEKEFGEPMYFDLGDNGGEVVFRTFNGVHEWATAEYESWRDTFQVLSQTTGVSPLISTLSTKLGGILSPMLDSENLELSESREIYREKIDRTMKLFEDGRRLTKEHPRRQAMTKLLSDAPFIILGEVTAMLDGDPYTFLSQINQTFQSHFLAGFVAAKRADNTYFDEAKKLKQSLDASKNELVTAREDIKFVGKSAKDLNERVEEAKQRQDRVTQDYIKQLEQLRASYVGEKQLAEPSLHWGSFPYFSVSEPLSGLETYEYGLLNTVFRRQYSN
ncbi:MAG: hypothetical protein HN377_09590 [Alphaproteobacteria bacterium]|jgi:hypothetical protein|nr:hypothetical protein [Alphaproteobacteria bacterium]MBT7943286.1 hypothetical protein [Alphaproteobacteria bacterium]